MSEPVLLQQDKIVRAGVCIIVRKHYQLLMICRTGSHGTGSWSVPGGWMEYGERPENTARREVLEEVGLNIATPHPAGGPTNDFFATEGKHSLTMWYIADVLDDGSEPSIKEQEKITAIAWVDEDGPYPEPLFLPLRNRIQQRGHLW